MRPHRSSTTRTFLALAGAAALVTALAACSDGGEGETPTGETSTVTDDPATDDATDDGDETEAPSDEPTQATSEDPGDDESPGIDDVPTASVGACLNLVDLAGGDGISELPTVDCTEEHDAQVFALVELPEGDYPGDDALPAMITEQCEPPFEAFVGTAPADSALEFDGIGPSADTWAVGDREIICLAFYPDLRTTTETFEGSGL